MSQEIDQLKKAVADGLQSLQKQIDNIKKNPLPFHVHNGMDAPTITPNDLAGFPIRTTAPTTLGLNGKLMLVGNSSSASLYGQVGGAWLQLGGGGFSSRARAYLSGDQSLTTGGARKITFDTENYDGSNEFDSTTNHRFVATSAGYYLITFSVSLATSITDQDAYIAYIKINNTTTAQSFLRASGTGQLATMITDVYHLAASDYVEGFVDTTSASNYTAKAGSNLTFIAVHRLS